MSGRTAAMMALAWVLFPVLMVYWLVTRAREEVSDERRR